MVSLTRSSKSSAPVSPLCEALAQRTGTRVSDWYPVFKARYGMREVFRAAVAAASTKNSDAPLEVVTQALTCCTAIAPILDAGARPRYVDIDPDTLSLDPDAVGDARVIVVQHTFGLVDDAAVRVIAEHAASTGALLIEDSAHAVARLAHAPGGEPVADISIHSCGVQKILPTHFGGAVWVNPALAHKNPELDALIRARLSALEPLGARLEQVCRLYFNQVRALSFLPRPAAHVVHQGLRRSYLMEPPIADTEYRGELPYRSQTPAAWMEAQAVAALASIEANWDLRRSNVQALVNWAREDGLEWMLPAGMTHSPTQPLLRVPLLACDGAQAEALTAAVRERVGYADRWGYPLLYPGVPDESLFALGPTGTPLARLPRTVEISARLVPLSTDLSPERTRAMWKAVAGLAA